MGRPVWARGTGEQADTFDSVPCTEPVVRFIGTDPGKGSRDHGELGDRDGPAGGDDAASQRTWWAGL